MRSSIASHPEARLAWEHLLPDFPMIRRSDTLEIHTASLWQASIELDCQIPADGNARSGGPGPWMMPVAFFSRHRVAHDLQVRDASGGIVAVPTMDSNISLTERALGEISTDAPRALRRPAGHYNLSQDIQKLSSDVMRMRPRDARVCRLEIAERIDDQVAAWLLPLLRRLEDHFLLWVPVQGPAGSRHHLTLSRREVRTRDAIFPKMRRKDQRITVASSVGDVVATWDEPRRWMRKPNLPAAVGRLLIACGLMPITIKNEALEAHRFSSYHLCVEPPEGFVMREIKAGSIEEARWGEVDAPVEPLVNDLDRTVQGEDSEIGHVHLEMGANPSRLYTRAAIGLLPGTITLWALVAVFTCGLLWVFHHNIDHLYKLDDKTKVAVGILLVGPTFAAAWTLREKDRALMRSMLSGMRLLMLASAALSVATALAIADLRPFHWEVGPAVSWYASISYTVAAFIVTGWLQTRGATWSVFRVVLTKTKWNLTATVVLACLSALAVTKFENFPAPATACLILSGLAFTAIAANRCSVPLGRTRHLPALIAGIGAILTLAIAARELDFYNKLVDRGFAHHWGMRAELGVAAAALILLVYGFGRRKLKSKKSAKNPAPMLESPK